MTAPTATVVLSGGAPNGALTAGALCGIYEEKKTFNTFYTSGAGAVFGLLTIAPKSGNAVEALKATRRVGIHDVIYELFPIGYKTFHKSGPFTFPLKRLAQKFKMQESDNPKKDNFVRFYNDWLDLVTAAVTPTFVTPRSEGVCAPFPFAEDFIDFTRIHQFRGRFYMNAYCIETGKMEHFAGGSLVREAERDPISVEHFTAALAFPFIYPPARVGGKHYYEGSALDPLNLPRLWDRIERGDIPNQSHTVVLIDLLGEQFRRALVRRPRNLVDAYGISIITPIVSLAETKLELFRSENKIQLLDLKFNIPTSLHPTLTDWSRSNLEKLFDIGHEAGVAFAKKHRDKLPDRAADSADPVDAPPPPADHTRTKKAADDTSGSGSPRKNNG